MSMSGRRTSIAAADICVARNVFNQVKNKVDLGFEDMGDQDVKNIAELVPGLSRALAQEPHAHVRP